MPVFRQLNPPLLMTSHSERPLECMEAGVQWGSITDVCSVLPLTQVCGCFLRQDMGHVCTGALRRTLPSTVPCNQSLPRDPSSKVAAFWLECWP